MAWIPLISTGPNLNLLDICGPEFHGCDALDEIKERCVANPKTGNLEIDIRRQQANADQLESCCPIAGLSAKIGRSP